MEFDDYEYNVKLHQKPKALAHTWEIDVPGDGSCLYWAVSLAYLLPALSNDMLFEERFYTLFGTKDNIQYIRKLLFSYNPFSDTSIFNDLLFDSLIKTNFRLRIIEYMKEAENIEKFQGFIDDPYGYEHYLQKMQESSMWGGEPELLALSYKLNCNILVDEEKKYPGEFQEKNPTLILTFTNMTGDHPKDKNHYHFHIKLDLGEEYRTCVNLDLKKPIVYHYNKGENNSVEVIGDVQGKTIENKDALEYMDSDFDPFSKDKDISDYPKWQDALSHLEGTKDVLPDKTNAIAFLWLAFQHAYFREIKDFQLFVKPKVTTIDDDQDFIERLMDEIQNSKNKSWLIDAHAGMGKTTLLLYLCNEYWKLFFSGKHKRIPLYIHLPQIKKEKLQNSMLQEGFSLQNELILKSIIPDKKLSSDEILWLSQQPLLLILDGVDEVSDRVNFYIKNDFGNENKHYDIKVVYGCRPEALLNENIDILFGVDLAGPEGSSCKRYSLLSLSDDQKREYISKYLSYYKLKTHFNWYYNWLTELPGLQEIVETPFLLGLVIKVLPMMVSKGKILQQSGNKDNEQTLKHFTRWFIYETFLWEWIKGQVRRLQKAKQLDFGGVFYKVKGSLEGYLFSYVSNLASEIWKNSQGYLEVAKLSSQQTLRSELMEPRMRTSISTNYEELFIQHLYEYEQLLRDYQDADDYGYSDNKFFQGLIKYDYTLDSWISVKHNEILPLKNKRLNAIRSGSLLKIFGDNYRFLHKTVVEYLTMERMTYDLRNQFAQYREALTSDKKDGNSSRLDINFHTIRNEQNMISLFVQQFEDDQEFKNLLGDIVYASKTFPELDVAASNSMTLLNAMGTDFSRMDLRDVQIPEADLRESVCDNTNFRGANLRGAWLHQAWLREANVSGANLTDVDFGVRAPLLHKGTVNSIAVYTKDPKDVENFNYWLVGCEDGFVYQWLISTSKNTLNFNHGHRWAGKSNPVTAVAVDSKTHRMVTLGNGIYVWRLTDKSNFNLLPNSTKEIGMTLSKDATYLATFSGDATVKIWNVSKLNQVHTLKKNSSIVTCVSFSSEGNYLAVGCEHGEISLVSIDNKCEQLKTISVHTQRVKHIAFHPGERALASSSDDNPLLYWSIDDENLNNSPFDTKANVKSFAFSRHKQNSSVAVTTNNTVLLCSKMNLSGKWEVATLEKHLSPINCICISHDDRFLALGCQDSKVKLFSLWGANLLPTLGWHTDRVLCVNFSVDGKELATAGADGKTILWSVENGECIGIKALNENTVVDLACITPDNEEVIFLNDENMYRYSLNSINSDQSGLKLNILPGKITHCASSHKSKLFAWGRSDGYIEILKYENNQYSRATHRCYEREVTSLAFSHNNILAVAYRGKGVVLLKLSENKIIREREIDNSGAIITSLSFNPNDEILAGGTKDNLIKIWYLSESRKNKYSLKIASESVSVEMSLSIGKEATMLAFERSERTQIKESILKGHSGPVVCLSFNAEHAMLASGSLDQTVCIWSLRMKKLLKTIKFQQPITQIIWKKNQSMLVVLTDTFICLFKYSYHELSQNVYADFSLYWLRGQNFTNFNSINVVQAIGVSHEASNLLSLHDVRGKPAVKEATYIPFNQILKPLSGTAQYGLQSSLIHVAGIGLTISSDVWVVTVARSKRINIQRSGKMNNANHTFLILEGIINYRRFIIRFDLTTPGKSVVIEIKTVDSKDYTIDNFKKSVENYEATQWQIIKEDGLRLIDNVREDQRKTMHYQMLGDQGHRTDALGNEFHSCVSWCMKQLNNIGINMIERWYHFIVKMPDDVIRSRSGSVKNTEKPQDSLLKKKSPKPSYVSPLFSKISNTHKKNKNSISINVLPIVKSIIDDRRLVSDKNWCISIIKNSLTKSCFFLIEGKVNKKFIIIRSDKIPKAINENNSTGLMLRLIESRAAFVSTLSSIEDKEYCSLSENNEFQGWVVSQNEVEILLIKLIQHSKQNMGSTAISSRRGASSSKLEEDYKKILFDVLDIELTVQWYDVKRIESLQSLVCHHYSHVLIEEEDDLQSSFDSDTFGEDTPSN